MFDEILEIKPYSLDQKEKLLKERLTELTSHHRVNCPEYKRILDAVSYDIDKVKSYTDLPFLPVRLFKERQYADSWPQSVDGGRRDP